MSNYICYIRCPYRQPSGYCGSTGGYETCQYRQLHSKKTNADRIRSMRDGELANFFDGIETKAYMSEYRGVLGWLEWLQQEV